jgi:hypothetical protein
MSLVNLSEVLRLGQKSPLEHGQIIMASETDRIRLLGYGVLALSHDKATHWNILAALLIPSPSHYIGHKLLDELCRAGVSLDGKGKGGRAVERLLKPEGPGSHNLGNKEINPRIEVDVKGSIVKGKPPLGSGRVERIRHER